MPPGVTHPAAANSPAPGPGGGGRRGTLLVLSGPSGAGKTTVYRQVLDRHPEVRFSVSCTTRAPRAGERDGIDYHFVRAAEFQARVDAGAFLEHAEVHGQRYGTLRAEVLDAIAAGADVLLDIDVQGARQIRAALVGEPWAAATLFVFCAPPSRDALRQRLRRRDSEPPEVIERRLQAAAAELAAWREYDWLVVNDDLATAVRDLEAILLAGRCRTTRFAEEPWQL